MAARANKRTRADAAILDRLECDSRRAQTPLESGQTQLTFDNKLSSSDGILAGLSCAADPQTPDISCDKSQSEGEAGDSDHAAIVDIEQGRAAVGTEAVPRADFDNLQAVVRQIADQMKWFTDKVSEDMALEGTDAVVDVPPLDSEQDNAELGPVPVTTVRAADGDADEADAQGQGLILNDLQAFYADNEKVGADIDPQLSSIIENLTKARLPDDKLKAKLDGYTRPRNTPTLIDTRVNLEIWNKLSPPTRSRDIKLQRIQHSLVQATVAVATGTDALVKALRSGESLACSNMALPMTALVDGLALMINANHDINQQRRDDKKGDLNLAYATLAASDAVTGSSLLYGDDLPSRIKEINEVNRVSSAVGHTSASSSSYGQRRGAMRGRGQRSHPYTTRGGRWTNRFKNAFLDEAGQCQGNRGRSFQKRGRFSKAPPRSNQRDSKQ